MITGQRRAGRLMPLPARNRTMAQAMRKFAGCGDKESNNRKLNEYSFY